MPRLRWPFHTKSRAGSGGSKSTESRLPATRTSAARAQEAANRTRQRQFVILAGVLLALGLWVALALWLPVNSDIEVGRPSPQTIQAPRSAEFVSELRTEEARAQARNRPENLVFQTNYSLLSEQRNNLAEFLNTITNIRNDPSLNSAEKRNALTSLPSNSLVVSDTLAGAILSLDESDWNTVRERTLTLYDRALSENEYEIDEQDLERLVERSLPFWTSSLPKLQRDLVLLFTTSFLRVNRTLDEDATAARKQEAAEEVEPVTINVQAGQTIVSDGVIVTPEMIEMMEATGALPRRLSWLDMSGLGIVATLLSFMTMIYLTFLQREIIRQPRALFAIIGLIILTALAARLLLPSWLDYPYAFPMATMVIVLAVIFNSHLGLAMAMLLSVVIGLVGDNSLELATIMLLGSVVAVFSVRGAERPLTFLFAGSTIALVTGLAKLGFWFVGTTDLNWATVGNIAFFSAINGVLSSILALGLFNLVGHIAGVVTPLQLMELAHPSQPLLRKVMREAPGTYSHSVSVGNLAESAAEAVGADALLLRVAAYYHDIGKTIRPYFFTDNQTGRENVHNDLDPNTSAAIIIDHVREGVKMAQEARLPQPIIDFISTHHGTGIVTHFYQLALRQQDTVNIDDFRYPGPKPFTREQGIMMLADSVEATVRAKAQHGQIVARHATESGSNGQAPGGGQTVDELVKSIIDDRVRTGQLDNTSLTLRDLVQIRQAFISSLQGIYHPRVDYEPEVIRS
jgi:hypothetical protein